MSTNEANWDHTVDVVVVGSGGGALTGAYTAAREGLNVLLVEASEFYGGTTAYSGGGGMWFPNNAALKRTGSTDTPEAARAYYRAVVGDRTPEALQDAYLNTGVSLVDYLEADPNGAFVFKPLPWPDYFGEQPQASLGDRHVVMKGVKVEDYPLTSGDVRGPLERERAGHPEPGWLVGGRALVARHLMALAAYDHAETRLNTRFDELVLDDDGAVLGAVVSGPEGVQRVRANRGVLLASGGFEQNDALRAQNGVPGKALDSMGAPANSGLGLTAGLAAGADTDLLDQAWWSPGLTHPDGSSTFAIMITAGIFVDNAGERFVNENAPYDRLGRRVLERVAAEEMTLPYWHVYDNRGGERPPVGSASVPIGETADYQGAGLWVTADTLEELAAIIDVPAEALVASVARYNELAAAGRDEDFGRGDTPYDRAFSGGASPLVPITDGPFHAAQFGVSDLGTKGGLRTDEHARVLRADGTVIAGLYAAGNTMAAVSGEVYPGGGNPIGSCMVFSHLAALDMAGRD